MKSGDSMDALSQRPIKEVIAQFPAIGQALDKFGIGCVPCSVGSCLFKDVVEIHGLQEDQKDELMFQIEKIIYPGKNIKRKKTAAGKKDALPKMILYSPPLKMLVDEHALIKKWLAVIPDAADSFDTVLDRQFILNGIDFIRSYADRYHHAKEEDILFNYCDKDLDIIKVILKDHETGRSYVKSALKALDEGKREDLASNLELYSALLTQHINKEDEILYPWIDRGLSTTQVGRLFSEFNEADRKADPETIAKCVEFAESAKEKAAKIIHLRPRRTAERKEK